MMRDNAMRLFKLDDAATAGHSSDNAQAAPAP